VVYVVKEKKAHLVPVRAFKEQGGLIEIDDFTHQLSPDSELILRGSGAVFPGAKVFSTNLEPVSQTSSDTSLDGNKKEQLDQPET